MTENYRDQIMVLQDSERIEDKLLLLSIYNELYSELKRVYTPETFNRKIDFAMRDSFDKTLLDLDFKGNSYTAIDFFNRYLNILKEHDALNLVKNKEHLIIYLNGFQDYLQNFANNMEYVDYIDASDELNLYMKTDLLCLFRKKQYDMNKTFELFENIQSNRDVYLELYHSQIDSLKNIINNINETVEGKNREQSFIDDADKEISFQMLNILKTRYFEGKINFDSFKQEVKKSVLRVFKKEDINFYVEKVLYDMCLGDDERSKVLIKKDLCSDLKMTSIKYFMLNNDFIETNKIIGYVRKNKKTENRNDK